MLSNEEILLGETRLEDAHVIGAEGDGMMAFEAPLAEMVIGEIGHSLTNHVRRRAEFQRDAVFDHQFFDGLRTSCKGLGGKWRPSKREEGQRMGRR